ncbi:hypothetical protein BAUCODRAFT_517403 [Baudoinia panamericana UAMH 10762]|uniref:Uncharacterized protein n=1 Tax=Baudoinia panamericana (strain UAMH 10762) TaxID=717646 RepID=M2LNY5_BAUPA|nr:uncharacterized protein BAUCODRAFT_517403 [Baudoinia panamericana UAMH 10762]EMC96087.1 hypothetical protein BAUCODRAFT_517403 [Baudoinia panamericana UAMH 10762]
MTLLADHGDPWSQYPQPLTCISTNSMQYPRRRCRTGGIACHNVCLTRRFQHDKQARDEWQMMARNFRAKRRDAQPPQLQTCIKRPSRRGKCIAEASRA